MLWFCLWGCLPGDSDDRQVLLSWSAEHDTCTAECIWMEVISLPPSVFVSHSLSLPLSLSVAVIGHVFCCRDDHGCHQKSQMKGGLYPHLFPSLLTPLFLSLPLSVISHPPPHLSNEQSQPPVPTNCSFYYTVCGLYFIWKDIYFRLFTCTKLYFKWQLIRDNGQLYLKKKMFFDSLSFLKSLQYLSPAKNLIKPVENYLLFFYIVQVNVIFKLPKVYWFQLLKTIYYTIKNIWTPCWAKQTVQICQIWLCNRD